MPHATPARSVDPRSASTLAIVALAALAALPLPASAQYAVPTGFVDELVIGGLSQPVGMAFLPDGRLLVVEQKSAKIRLVVNGAFAATDPVTTVANVKTIGNEQGLLGIAVDPGWPGRPYIYVHYDYSGSGNIRVSRYTVGGDLAFTGNGSLTINAATRYDILTDIPDVQLNHNGGTLRFGPDGMLYDSIGDDATSCNAQDFTSLAGKILRLNVSGLPAGGGGPPAKSAITPADNPYVSMVDPNAKLIGYLGLRNPFRFAIDPASGAVMIGDVGENLREEVDFVTSLGLNFEWPHREGDIAGPTTCPGADVSRFTEPIYTYDHTLGAAIVGGVIYRAPLGAASPFPAGYQGDIFFSDFYSTWLHRLKNTGGNWALASAPGQPNANDWGAGESAVSDYAVGPDGSLFYCALGGGEIRRIRYGDTTSVPPPPAVTIEFRPPYPSPASGQVSFDFVLPTSASVSLSVYDLRGGRVRTIDAGIQPAGLRGVSWDLHDENGRAAPAGVYVVRLAAGETRIEQRFVVAR
jgi:glucose/arabinose dehydrogenase